MCPGISSYFTKKKTASNYTEVRGEGQVWHMAGRKDDLWNCCADSNQNKKKLYKLQTETIEHYYFNERQKQY
jgi:hypothetical protein